MTATSKLIQMSSHHPSLFLRHAPQRATRLKVLCLDGGGMRGIVPATILAALEDQLIAETGKPDTRLVDYFDLFAGTSTGGILTCLYLLPDLKRPDRPRFSARQVLDLYCQEGPAIFYRSPRKRLTSLMGLAGEKFDSQQMTKIMRRFMLDTRLKELVKPCLIPAYDIQQQSAYYFNSETAKSQPSEDYAVWQVAQSTASAPIYFGPFQAQAADGNTRVLIDGGVFANNPSMSAYHHLQQLLPEPANLTMVSLGTGCTSQAYAMKDLKAKGLLNCWKPLIHILGTAKSRSTEQLTREVLESAAAGHNYFRINPPLTGASSNMDDVSAHQITSLRSLGESYIKQKQAMMQKLVYQLLA